MAIIDTEAKYIAQRMKLIAEGRETDPDELTEQEAWRRQRFATLLKTTPTLSQNDLIAKIETEIGVCTVIELPTQQLGMFNLEVQTRTSVDPAILERLAKVIHDSIPAGMTVSVSFTTLLDDIG